MNDVLDNTLPLTAGGDSYYHDDRTHLSLEKQTPEGRVAATDTDASLGIVAMPRLGGLHHRYELAA